MPLFLGFWDAGEAPPDYPTLKIDWSSRKVPRDGRVISQEGDALTRIRTLHGDFTDFNVVHSGISEDDVDELLDFYEGKLTEQFSFAWPPEPGVLYPVKFAARPRFVERKGHRWTYEVKLVGTITA